MNADHPPLVGYEDFADAGAAVQAQNATSAQSPPDAHMPAAIAQDGAAEPHDWTQLRTSLEAAHSTFVADVAESRQPLAIAPDVHSAIVELERARMLPEVVAGHPVVVAEGSILHFMDEDGRLMRIVANEAGALSKAPCA